MRSSLLTRDRPDCGSGLLAAMGLTVGSSARAAGPGRSGWSPRHRSQEAAPTARHFPMLLSQCANASALPGKAGGRRAIAARRPLPQPNISPCCSPNARTHQPCPARRALAPAIPGRRSGLQVIAVLGSTVVRWHCLLHDHRRCLVHCRGTQPPPTGRCQRTMKVICSSLSEVRPCRWKVQLPGSTS